MRRLMRRRRAEPWLARKPLRGKDPKPAAGMRLETDILLTRLRWALTMPVLSAARVPALHGAMQADAEINALIQAMMALRARQLQQSGVLGH